MRSPSTHKLARRLRRAMSPPEVLIWVRLRRRSADLPAFRRQHPVGPYVADFFCTAAGLVVEIDGATHSEDTKIAHDRRRDAYLRERGLEVLRITGSAVMADPDGCADGIILAALERIGSLRG